MMKKSGWMICLLGLFININASAKDLLPGSWKFYLRTTNAEIPFIIEFKYDKHKVLTGRLHNGLETITLTGITQKDKDIVIPLQAFELTLELTQQDEKTLSGSLVRHNKNPATRAPVVGIHGIKERFTYGNDKPMLNLNGKWALVLEDEQGVKSPALGNFKQIGGVLSGSILTPTGDYRYLEGYVSGWNFEAASFDGVYNYVFRGQLKDGKMDAALLSSTKTKVTGSLDPKASLPDAYAQTSVDQLGFIFPNEKGELVSLTNKKYKNKAVIIQIYGSWCPNCLDEMNYLIAWYKQNNKRGVEIIALAFERSLSPEDAKRQLIKVKKKFNIPYQVLQAGSTAEDKPMEKLPELKNFISFPTTIFLNKQHKVLKVHAGFSGPSTKEFYETLKKEFNANVNQALK